MRLRGARLVRAVVVGAGGALLALLVARLGLERILSLMSSLGGNILVIVGLFAAHECVRALAVGRCFADDEAPPFRALLRIRFLGEAVGALTRTGPLGAEPLRAWMLAGHTGPGPHAYAAALSELIANSCVSAAVTVAVGAPAILVLPLHGPLLVLCHVLLWSSLVYVCAAVLALAVGARPIAAIARGMAGLPAVGRRLRTDPAKVREMEDAVLHALTGRPRVLAEVILLELAAQFILVLEIFVTIRSMGVALSAVNALFVEVVAKAANLIQFVGVTEAGYAVLFNWLGLTAAVGFTLSVVKVLRSVITAGLGLAILSGWTRREAA